MSGRGMMTRADGSGPSPFPSLPIVTPDPPARTDREKYGWLLRAAVIGLVVVVALVAWTGYRVWAMRDVWAQVYVLHDRDRSDDDRIRAAFALARDPRVEPRQRWEMALRLGLPELARCLLADGVGVELVAEDPQAYASAVARSPDWPGWLRLALTQPLALAASQGHTLSRERLGDLCRLGDPIVRLWALYTLAVQPRPDPETMREIERVSREATPEHELAAILLEAIPDSQPRRQEVLGRAVEWGRRNHPDTKRVWSGWRIEGDRLIRVPG